VIAPPATPTLPAITPPAAPVAPPAIVTPSAPVTPPAPVANNPNNNRPGNPPANAAGFGLPLTGLTDAQLVAFADGREDFVQRETPATGLGPIFNDVSCAACHSAPAIGGASGRTVTRFGHTADGVFDPLAALGGSLLQDRSVAGIPRETVPAAANVVARRVTTPVFGAGLIEAIPDSTIVAGTLAPKPDGIRGRVSVVTDVATGALRIGRFGWKAQHASLLAFSADAYANEMGITNRFFPAENAPNGNTAAIARFEDGVLDDVTDPADGRSATDRLADYMRFLAAPPRAAANASALAGEQRFAALGCASCHTPTLTTGPHPVAALSEKPVALYSDLLLHDMGALGDGIVQGTAGARDMRTAPLWGLRTRNALLHDGRARTPDAAIRAHDGEAAAIRDAYLRLADAERQQLLDFLNTL
jgi:CxxC motif-containing protein (DUF1111 family)